MEQTGAFDVEFHLRRKNIVMDFFYTIIVCTAIAFVIAFSNPTSHLSVSFIMAQSFGLTICSLITLMLHIFRPRQWPTLILIMSAATICGAVVGLNIGFYILEMIFAISLNFPMKDLLKIIFVAVVFSGA
ncbi:MAG: hypothetical protein CVU72_02465, partial [Deltaproteobacteria bacterium HGW-Deltaproteobacteria-7]